MKNTKIYTILEITKILMKLEMLLAKYGQNAKIHLGGIPMIADDMMSFIKSDIVSFWYWCFYFYSFNSLVYF